MDYFHGKEITTINDNYICLFLRTFIFTFFLNNAPFKTCKLQDICVNHMSWTDIKNYMGFRLTIMFTTN